MKKAEFLEKLKSKINEYPQEETQKSLEYYEEMIDDRMEDGMTEDEAVASLGKVDEIAEEIKCELPLTTLVKYKAKEKTKGEKIPGWAIALLILGSPLWLSLLLPMVLCVFVVYLLVWVVALVFWVCEAAMIVSAVACVLASVVMLVTGKFASCLLYLGGGLLLGGVSILLFIASYLISKGIIVGTAWLFKQIKKAILAKDNEPEKAVEKAEKKGNEEAAKSEESTQKTEIAEEAEKEAAEEAADEEAAKENTEDEKAADEECTEDAKKEEEE